MTAPSIVLKFGSSVLEKHEDLRQAVHEIYRFRREGYNVLAVVSAIGDTTDLLLREARRFSESPDPVAEAYLLASGEQQSAALLTITAQNAGIPARAIDPRDIGFFAAGDVLDAEPVRLDSDAVRSLFNGGEVLILPGFFAAHEEHGIALLGRGGSDFSAVYLASKLGAGTRCRLLKDVDGLYESDPALPGPPPNRYDVIHWSNAIELASQLVQPKAVRFAEENGQSIEIARCGMNRCSLIGPGDEKKLPNPAKGTPLRVALIGLGTVNTALYHHLLAMPDVFEVASIIVRDKEKHLDKGIPGWLLSKDIEDAFAAEPQILVEAIGGLDPAGDIILRALQAGCHVVSANKQVIAARGLEFESVAEAHDARLLYSAAVGGAVPILELIDQQPPGTITSIEGVVNGTTNYVIDQLAAGLSYEEAVKMAQDMGFAEADPTADVEGFDALAKIRICARHAFGAELSTDHVSREGIANLDASEIQSLKQEGQCTRHVARCWVENGTPVASIKPETLDASDFLAGAKNEGNRVFVSLSDGRILKLSGKGAGAAPTAEAVLADVMEIKRLFARQRIQAAHAAE